MDNHEEFVGPTEILRELHADNKAIRPLRSLRGHVAVSKANENRATTSLVETRIDEAERRAWLLFEATR